jgi:hypothetical protein
MGSPNGLAARPIDFRQSRQALSKEIIMSSSATGLPTPEGMGSVSGRAPDLPAGFGKTFTSRYVDTGGLRQHVVIGGSGPPLLVRGWPENWHMWRLVMPGFESQAKGAL